ncbi:MAG TPA: hypothetical protein VM864_03240 [Pyrinomonadaceae bacterium]|jgi:hypothetical protein|nr:hypothetical protein [Pyrinomonadaceae bacterium]
MKKFLSLALSALLLHASGPVSLATDGPLERNRKALLARQVRAGVSQLGAGKSSVVRVVLYDNTKYHGHITEITDEGFVVADARTGATAPIYYREVKGIKGNSFSTGAKVCVGVAIAATIAVIIAAVVTRGGDEESRSGFPRCITSPCP